MGNGSIFVTVKVNVGTPDKTLLRNIVTMDYSDANGNFVEQKMSSADVVVTAPVMTLEKNAGEVTVGAYVIADFRLRIAGEKWHDVILTLYDGNISAAFASITRYPGSPDDQSVTIYDVKINLFDSFTAIIEYTPIDDPNNGQWWGDDPCWLILTFQDGDTVRLKHNFNVRHNKTWIWIVDDFTPYVKGHPITYEATIPYSIIYENIGTGDASNVIVTDTFPTGSVVVDTNPLFDSCVSSVCTWYVGDVVSGGKGYIFVNITYIFDVNGTVVTNEVTMDYSDANGNFIEQLYDFADSILITPEIPDKSTKGKNSMPPIDLQSQTSTPDTALVSEVIVGPISTVSLPNVQPLVIETRLTRLGDGINDVQPVSPEMLNIAMPAMTEMQRQTIVNTIPETPQLDIFTEMDRAEAEVDPRIPGKTQHAESLELTVLQSTEYGSDSISIHYGQELVVTISPTIIDFRLQDYY